MFRTHKHHVVPMPRQNARTERICHRCDAVRMEWTKNEEAAWHGRLCVCVWYLLNVLSRHSRWPSKCIRNCRRSCRADGTAIMDIQHWTWVMRCTNDVQVPWNSISISNPLPFFVRLALSLLQSLSPVYIVCVWCAQLWICHVPAELLSLLPAFSSHLARHPNTVYTSNFLCYWWPRTRCDMCFIKHSLARSIAISLSLPGWRHHANTW